MYDFNKNSMNYIPFLQNDHTGGSLVYVPEDNYIYAISGFTTNTVEKLKFNPTDRKIVDDKWTYGPNFPDNRIHFSTFVVNGRSIYIILGYDNNKKAFYTSGYRLDTMYNKSDWVDLNINSLKSPRLKLAAVINSCEGSVFVLGGLVNSQEVNSQVYIFNYYSGTWNNTEFVIDDINENPNVIDNEKNNDEEKDNSYNSEIDFKKFKRSSLIFMSNTQFNPMKYSIKEFTSTICYGIFDSSGYFHLINVRSFDHLILFQDEIIELNENSSDSEKSKNSQNSDEDDKVKNNSFNIINENLNLHNKNHKNTLIEVMNNKEILNVSNLAKISDNKLQNNIISTRIGNNNKSQNKQDLENNNVMINNDNTDNYFEDRDLIENKNIDANNNIKKFELDKNEDKKDKLEVISSVFNKERSNKSILNDIFKNQLEYKNENPNGIKSSQLNKIDELTVKDNFDKINEINTINELNDSFNDCNVNEEIVEQSSKSKIAFLKPFDYK